LPYLVLNVVTYFCRRLYGRSIYDTITTSVFGMINRLDVIVHRHCRSVCWFVYSALSV